jgi:hypothetical protein
MRTVSDTVEEKIKKNIYFMIDNLFLESHAVDKVEK